MLVPGLGPHRIVGEVAYPSTSSCRPMNSTIAGRNELSLSLSRIGGSRRTLPVPWLRIQVGQRPKAITISATTTTTTTAVAGRWTNGNIACTTPRAMSVTMVFTMASANDLATPGSVAGRYPSGHWHDSLSSLLSRSHCSAMISRKASLRYSVIRVGIPSEHRAPAACSASDRHRKSTFTGHHGNAKSRIDAIDRGKSGISQAASAAFVPPCAPRLPPSASTTATSSRAITVTAYHICRQLAAQR